ncbi:hypothetical protein AMK68_04080 [candidate division KD3-62 bacterium DG_56]|uniref:Peptidoglycan binding-like domain-containing protein n=1 Tax=candidate division KD3-62 bacterium DG_56 TaxID=1704032 RepID=A0A0S7XL87_9BACT|nr:MAG: hypothetical protein AMK68_04080 [candidate division KD3-62 bacterium DG_56]
MSKKEVIKTLLQAGRPDLANAAVAKLAAAPVTRFTREQVTAASLSRVLQHFDSKDPNVGVVIVSADRSDRGLVRRDGSVVLDPELNERLNKTLRKQLEARLRSLGSGGYIRTMGGYIEQGKLVYEMSYIVPGVKHADAIKFAKEVGKDARFNAIDDDAEKLKKGGRKLATSMRQDAVIWGNNTAGAWLIDYKGKETYKLGTVTKTNQIRDLFTEMKRRKRLSKREEDVKEELDAIDLNTIKGRQQALRWLGYHQVRPTGKWDAASQNALTQYQEKHEIDETNWGEDTAVHIRKALDPQALRKRVTFASCEYVPTCPSDWRQWQVTLARICA